MSEIFAIFVEPFQFAFMQNALPRISGCRHLCTTLLLFGVERMVIDGDAISCCSTWHCLSFFSRIPLVIGAFVSGIACALGVGYLKENSRIKEDTAMGIVFSGMFAIGLVLFTKIQTSQHLTHILFGNVLGVSRQELIQTGHYRLDYFYFAWLKAS